MKTKDLHKGTEERVPKVEIGADQRALGVQVDMEGCRSGAVANVAAEVEVAARTTRQMPSMESLAEV